MGRLVGLSREISSRDSVEGVLLASLSAVGCKTGSGRGASVDAAICLGSGAGLVSGKSADGALAATRIGASEAGPVVPAQSPRLPITKILIAVTKAIKRRASMAADPRGGTDEAVAGGC